MTTVPDYDDSAVWANGTLAAFGGASYSGQRVLAVTDHAWLSTP